MNELQELENLLNQLLAGLQDVIQSGEVLSDEFQGVIAQELEYLTTNIDRLRAEGQGTDITPQPELEEAMPSSNVSAFRYDDKTNRLLVQFLGRYPNRRGPIYAYEGVPKEIFQLFQRGAVPARTNGRNRWGAWWRGKVPSIGASLYTLLAQGPYQYQRLS